MAITVVALVVGVDLWEGAKRVEAATPPDESLDCEIYQAERWEGSVGVGFGGFMLGVTPELGLAREKGIAWNERVQELIARYLELCTRYNAGLLTETEYKHAMKNFEQVYQRMREEEERQVQKLRQKRDNALSRLDQQLKRKQGVTSEGGYAEEEAERLIHWATDLLRDLMHESQVYARAAPAVVYIEGLNEAGVGSSGTGSIIRADGLILTNAHVVLEEPDGSPYARLKVGLNPELHAETQIGERVRMHEAQVVAMSRPWDLALLQVETELEHLPVLELGEAENMEIGDPVVAIGHPEKGARWTLTRGVISGQHTNFQGREGWQIWQTDASLNRGNSGGPLLNRSGELIGVNVLMARQAPDGFPITDINFAIKANVVTQWLRIQGVKLSAGIAGSKAAEGQGSFGIPQDVMTRCSTPEIGDPLGPRCEHESGPSEEYWLITQQMARLSPPPTGRKHERGNFTESGSPLHDSGPIIKVEKPTADSQQTFPLEILVRFVPREAPVELSTLKVELLKFFTIDLTERVRPYASLDGIYVPEVQVPSGEHTIRLMLADTVGGLSIKEFTVTVL